MSLDVVLLIADLAAAIALEADHLVENFGADEVFLAEACHLGCRECALELARDRLVERHKDDISRIFGDSVLRAARGRHPDGSCLDGTGGPTSIKNAEGASA